MCILRHRVALDLELRSLKPFSQLQSTPLVWGQLVLVISTAQVWESVCQGQWCGHVVPVVHPSDSGSSTGVSARTPRELLSLLRNLRAGGERGWASQHRYGPRGLSQKGFGFLLKKKDIAGEANLGRLLGFFSQLFPNEDPLMVLYKKDLGKGFTR